MVFIYHNDLREICCMHTHTQTLSMIIFFWKIRIVPATQNFSFCFNRLTKLTTFAPAVITNPLFAQNVLELTLVLPEAATRGVLFKNLFLEISLYYRKTPVLKFLSEKYTVLQAWNFLLKKTNYNTGVFL